MCAGVVPLCFEKACAGLRYFLSGRTGFFYGVRCGTRCVG
ncbi:hypothetical protein AmDm5_2143 [Acetobacter malorum]|nr:hypothetical protein AmDm5_2143 [Acetobacter malorum]